MTAKCQRCSRGPFVKAANLTGLSQAETTNVQLQETFHLFIAAKPVFNEQEFLDHQLTHFRI